MADTNFLLGSFGIRPLANLVIWMADKPILRAFGQYMLGLLMVIQRAAGGNTTYFMGEISAIGWRSYFPILYFFKEQLAFHIFSLIAIIYSISNLLKAREKNINSIVGWLKDNFVLTAGMIFIAVYWFQSISSPLNIGVRHVLPTFPFIYFLVSRQIIRWSKVPSLENPQTLSEWIRNTYSIIVRSFKKHMVLWILMFWIILGTIAAFPFYLSYYNELSGGTLNGYKIATDSNYDWGQDLKRLEKWVNDYNFCATKWGTGDLKLNNCPNKFPSIPWKAWETPKPINKIAIDYFGGGNPKYYFGDKFESWWSSKGQPPAGTWFAISATFRQGAFANPVANFTQNPQDTYSWLKDKIPVARAGTSIFIYKF